MNRMLLAVIGFLCAGQSLANDFNCWAQGEKDCFTEGNEVMTELLCKLMQCCYNGNAPPGQWPCKRKAVILKVNNRNPDTVPRQDGSSYVPAQSSVNYQPVPPYNQPASQPSYPSAIPSSNPQAPQLYNPSAPQQTNPPAPQQYQPQIKPHYDPQTGRYYDPQTGQTYNPPSGQPSNPQPGRVHTYHPQTGQPYSYNPQTGQYYDPQTGYPVDQVSGYPYNPQTGQLQQGTNGFQQVPPQPGQTQYQQQGQQPAYQPPGGQQPVPVQPQQSGLPPFQPQGSQPAQKPSDNVNNLLNSLGISRNTPPPSNPGEGALGTSVSAPSPLPPPSNGGSSGGDNFQQVLGYSRCSIANSIENESTKQSLLKNFQCTGNEPKIPKEEADKLLNSFLGGSTGQPSPPSEKPVQPKTLPIPAPVPAGPAVGSQLPNYQYIRPRQTPQEIQMCALLKSVKGNMGVSLKLQYRCGATGNTLIDLVTGNLPPGLSGVPSLLQLFGGAAGATKEENIITEGAINPDRIPESILIQCIKTRYDYVSCRNGFNTNIQTATECFNVGCVFYKGEYSSRCFRCGLVPSSAYIFQDNADTCAVEEGNQETCPGFKTVQLTIITLDRQQATAAPVTQNPLAGLLGSNPALSGLLGNPALSGLLNNPIFSGLVGRSGLSSNNQNSQSSNDNYSDQSGNTQQSEGGFSSKSQPAARQLNLQNLLMSGLGGGGLGGSSNANLLQLLASGGDTSGTNLLSAFGGLPKISPEAIKVMETNCQQKGCCWKTGGNLGGTCYIKGRTFPTGCFPDPDSGTCGKSPVNVVSRIIGGTALSSNGARPWMALIRFNGKTELRCGGALICSQWIVTTASCLEKKAAATSNGYVPNVNPDTLQVWVATTNPSDPDADGIRMTINKIIVHPRFTFQQSYNDIALLRVNRVIFTPAKRPVCLPSLTASTPTGTIYFSGFGGNKVGGVQSPLSELPFTVLDPSACSGKYFGSIPQSGIFCAESPPYTDTCYGDGGSPVVKYDADSDVYTIVGLNFGGSDKCDGSKPSLFTDISVFMPWIAKTTNGCCELAGSRPG